MHFFAGHLTADGQRLVRAACDLLSECVSVYTTEVGGAGAQVRKKRDAGALLQLPKLTEEVTEALAANDAGLFRDMWSRLQTVETVEVAKEDGPVTVLAPVDRALRAMLPRLREEVPDPLVEDAALMRFVVASHVFVGENAASKDELDGLVLHQEIARVNVMGETVVIKRKELKGGRSTETQILQ